MNNWTPAALQVLKNYLEQNRIRVATTGGDGEEIVGDLRRHVEAEIAELKLPVVTEQDVHQVVQKLGPLSAAEPVAPVPPKPSDTEKGIGTLDSMCLLVFGFLLPAITLGFELVTHACASGLFDPIPTWFHVFVIAVVPLANLLAWRAANGKCPSTRWLWLANGVAFGISLYYAVLFLPISLFALPGIIVFGVGLLPLSPLLAAMCALRLRSHLRKQEEPLMPLRGSAWWGGSIGALSLIILLAIPGVMTRHWITKASRGSEVEAADAIRSLRRFGNEEILLRECYGQTDRTWINAGNQANSETARKVYYRVTGRAFNSVTPPVNKYEKRSRALFEDFAWDDGLGGEAVAGQIRNLSLAQSRMDAVSKPEEGWGYLEWIMEFQNDNPSVPREARAQIQLPPGAVVSRLTLWVNGEEREAAFSGRSQVRKAYQSVAVQRSRDPVLVTTSGPDRVLMQCFPVPANGKMKVRLGITAPLEINGTNSLALRLPCFVERNFGGLSKLEHNFWLQSSKPARSSLKGVVTDGNGLHGPITDSDLSSANAVLWFDGAPLENVILAGDSHRKELTIKQVVETKNGKLPSRVAIVLDGSRDMTPYYSQIAAALRDLPSEAEVSIWLQQDGLEQVVAPSRQAQAVSAEVVSKVSGRGGQDNMPGLLRAWEWAAEKKGGVAVWIHAAQPLLLENSEALQQRLDWRTGGDAPVIIDVPVQPGPNRVAEQLANSPAVISLSRLGSIQDDLKRLFATWSGGRTYQYVRTVSSSTPDLDATGSSHIARLWALNETRNFMKLGQAKEALTCATIHQLVTPVSGAVVLETKAQFDEFGLTPVDPMSVPSVPEPSSWILGVMAIIGFFVWRKCNTRTWKSLLVRFGLLCQ